MKPPFSALLFLSLSTACYWDKDPGSVSTPNPSSGNNGGTTAQDAGKTAVSTSNSSNPAKVFVTRATYKGNLGGIVGANDKCRQAASNAKLSGMFVAFLSADTGSALSRISGKGPWVNMVGQTIFSDTPSSWSGFPASSLDYDEYGQPASPPDYWTGSAQGGTSSGLTCSGWSSTSARGTMGTGVWTDSKWISSMDMSCNFEMSLLCVELR